jgi:hypothetical protein
MGGRLYPARFVRVRETLRACSTLAYVTTVLAFWPTLDHPAPNGSRVPALRRRATRHAGRTGRGSSPEELAFAARLDASRWRHRGAGEAPRTSFIGRMLTWNSCGLDAMNHDLAPVAAAMQH